MGLTFFSLCPKEIIKNFNQTTLEVTFINGSVLTFIEANISKDPMLNKLKGLEIGWFGIDEANEVAHEVFIILQSRLRWVLPNASLPCYEGRLTSNPENCWLIPVFVRSVNPSYQYIPAVTTDNYNENDEYVIGLKEAFKDSPNLLKKYLLGDWTAVDGINQLISIQHIEKCVGRVDTPYNAMGVDVARYGEDRTVIVLMLKGNIELIEVYQNQSITDTASRVLTLMQEYNIHPQHVGVDAVGIGSGVIDILAAQHYHVCEIQGGASPIDKDIQEAFKPFNLRSQMYYQLMKDIRDGNIGNLTDENLKMELQSIQYEIVSEKTVKILPKEAIKKLLGKSPDLADALAYCNWSKSNFVYMGEYPIC